MMFQSVAAGLLFSLGALAQSVIDSGQGFGTYYYDIKQIDACGTSFKYQNEGGVMCSYSTLLPLNEMNTNYVVAMNSSLLRDNLSLYCGKKVAITVNGQRSNLPLFIGDGCERCSLGSPTQSTWNSVGAPGLDFSYSVLSELSDGKACSDGHIDISWEILDEQIYNFDGSSSGPTAAGAGASTSELAVDSADSTTMATKLRTSHATGSSTSCSNNAWQCNGNVIEQCIDSTWTPRATCSPGARCMGGSNPYCI